MLTIFNKDQKDREDSLICNDGKLLTKNDVARKKIVREFIRKNDLSSAEDYFMAGMIFHHGRSIRDSTTAVRLLKKSHEMEFPKALALYAMCLDRLLIKQGHKQKFGTQYRRKHSKSEWIILPIDSSTTDTERKKYNILPLKKLIANVKKLNSKK